MEVCIVTSGGYSGKFLQSQCEIQLTMDNLGEQKVLESTFFRLIKSLKSKILATMVPPPRYKPPILSYSGVGTYALSSALKSPASKT